VSQYLGDPVETRCGILYSRRKERERGRIDYSQVLGPEDESVGVDDGHGVVLAAHLVCSGCMVH